MKMNEMGNQQVKDTDLAWLAGIIDGEGSILLGSKGHRGEFPGYNGLMIGATIHVTNTCGNIISKCEKILDALGVSFRTSDKTTASNKTQVWRIDMGKMTHIKTFLTAVSPYLVSKHGQADIVLRFVTRRMARTSNGKAQPYDAGDKEVIDEYFSKYYGKRQPTKTLALPERANIPIDRRQKPQRLNTEEGFVGSYGPSKVTQDIV